MGWIFIILMLVIAHVGLYKIFEKAGVEGWKALVPVYGGIEWFKILGKPLWKVFFMWFPIVNLFMVSSALIDTSNSFGRYSFKDHFLSVVFAPFYLCFLGFSKDERFLHPGAAHEREWKEKMKAAMETGKPRTIAKTKAENPYGKGILREWAEAVIFAVFAASFIRMFLIEAFVIPTQSMEGSLMVGDFLFVSKWSYGIRTPKTPLMLPLMNNRIPTTTTESYSTLVQWPFHRLFGSTDKVKKNDPVVFNFPEGDTIIVPQSNALNRKVRGTYNYYNILREPYYYGNTTPAELNNPSKFKKVVRPIDKRDFYIKRCVATAGDELEIRNRQVYVNGSAVKNPKNIQFLYYVTPDGSTRIDPKKLLEWGIHVDDLESLRGSQPAFHMNAEQVEKVKAMPGVASVDIKPIEKPSAAIFPHDLAHFAWTRDNFGPVRIPKAGETVAINIENIALYTRIIRAFEGNQLDIKGNQVFINGEPATSYTFKMDYFWMMGDNRHNSEDSRIWGFVPQDHIVGKPLFIWFSLKNGMIGGDAGGVQWHRIFSGAYRMD